jgi:NADH-quinone oxidoreductase subunit N
MLIGFGFKVAAVPFHMWTPDAYEGAPTPITSFMAVGVKLAAFAGFVRIFLVNLGPVSGRWTMVLWVMAVLTMTVGNISAIVQTDIKRMLAYSAIAHAGYMLVAMAAAPAASAGGAILYYLLGYAFATVGAFAVIIALEHSSQKGTLITDYRGLARSHPGVAAAMALFMLSFAGVPPLAGFVGKAYIISAALRSGLVWLAVITVINSAMSAYYYIGVIVAMYMQDGDVVVERMGARPGLLFTIEAGVAGTVIIGVYPQPSMNAAVNAYAAAVGRPALHTTASLR